MDDLANHKRAKKINKQDDGFPKGILDVIETDYPDKYIKILEGQTQLESLLSNEEWIDILTKSRNSFRSHVDQIKKARKHLLYGDRSEITQKG